MTGRIEHRKHKLKSSKILRFFRVCKKNVCNRPSAFGFKTWSEHNWNLHWKSCGSMSRIFHLERFHFWDLDFWRSWPYCVRTLWFLKLVPWRECFAPYGSDSVPIAFRQALCLPGTEASEWILMLFQSICSKKHVPDDWHVAKIAAIFQKWAQAIVQFTNKLHCSVRATNCLL